MSKYRTEVLTRNIPKEMIAVPHWVCWKNLTIRGRLSKIPFDPHGKGWARVNDPYSWGTFEEAINFFNQAEPSRQWGLYTLAIAVPGG